MFTDNDGDGSFDAVAGDTLTQNARVFIDTNRDGQFTDGIDVSTLTDANGNWTLQQPVSASGEFLRIRVEDRASFETTLPGEAEDLDEYSVFVQPGDTPSETFDFAFVPEPGTGDGGDGGTDGGDGGTDGGDGGDGGDAGTDGGDGGTDGGGGGPMPGTISGTVFNDLDGNGFQSFGEGGLSNITVFLDINGNGSLDTDLNEPSRVTNIAGSYEFASIAPGAYSVRVVAESPFQQTSPTTNFGSQIVTLASGGLATDVTFGVQNLATSDYGDLGGNFPTLAGGAVPGASHRISSTTYLGAAPPDGEIDGQPTPNADGDDVSNGDEDGVVVDFGSDGILSPDELFTITVTVAGVGGFLSAWMDFDGDGEWSADERIFDDKPLAPGVHTLTRRFEGDADTTLLQAPSDTTTVNGIGSRFRWGPELDNPETPNPTAFGGAVIGGEVEDYLFSQGVFVNAVSVGDYDGSGSVDAGDLGMFQEYFGDDSSGTADGNTDGVVNAADYTIWRDNVGLTAFAVTGPAIAPATAPPVAPATAPPVEPELPAEPELLIEPAVVVAAAVAPAATPEAAPAVAPVSLDPVTVVEPAPVIIRDTGTALAVLADEPASEPVMSTIFVFNGSSDTGAELEPIGPTLTDEAAGVDLALELLGEGDGDYEG
ncbi:MAG: GEVED domain-containing protein, partial [Planctomycetota bacterium]